MNSLTIVLMVLVGAVLVYSAVKGTDPRELIKQALRKGK
jgi:hypothetical protein